jgi:hypothetical protein
MEKNILEKFSQLFAKLDEPDVQMLGNLVQETLAFFEEVKTVLQTGTDEEKKEAVHLMHELEKKLEEQAEKAHKASGYTKEQIEEVLEDPKTFSEEEKESYEKIKKDLSSYQKDFLKKAIAREGEEKITGKKKRPKKEKFRG